jgi:nitrite reductase (NADH) small subunit
MEDLRRPVEIGTVEDIPVGTFKIMEIEGVEVGVTRLADGEVRAVRNYCPHKGAPICRGPIGGTWPPCEPGQLEFVMAGEVLVCPWHGFEYDLNTGRELFRETPTRLVMYSVTVENGRVSIDVSRRRSVAR